MNQPTLPRSPQTPNPRGPSSLEMPSRPRRRLSLLDLPVELYMEITRQLSPADLFHLALASKLNRHLVLKILYKREVREGLQNRALWHGLSNRIPSTLAFVRESGVQSFDLILSPPYGYDPQYPLIRAAAARDTSFVDTLLMYGCDPNLVSPGLQTPLSTILRASVEGSPRRCPMEMVLLLLKRGARADIATPRNKHPSSQRIYEALELASSPLDWTKLKENPAAPSPYARIAAMLATALREWPADDKESPVQLAMKLGTCDVHDNNSCLISIAKSFFDVAHESLTPADAEALANWMVFLGAADDGEICLFLYDDRRRYAKRRCRSSWGDNPPK
ncbi:hypothetical protein B0T19DRAFT_488190 [Cercophora scortea]|uniref:F-box domain-containing protein n=1 Tax=Cercophora scortea TaxID=314031 RepID=A0AAE0I7E8_9PEZI|nr:hypothetical protein B0T19DRAFT_488190 [Cercophora scortea]